MPDSIDSITAYQLREMALATKPAARTVAIVWMEKQQVSTVVKDDTTTLEAKTYLEETAKVDLLEDDWAVAYYADGIARAMGFPSLRQTAISALEAHG